jgi:hypothetical protein
MAINESVKQKKMAKNYMQDQVEDFGQKGVTVFTLEKFLYTARLNEQIDKK